VQDFLRSYLSLTNVLVLVLVVLAVRQYRSRAREGKSKRRVRLTCQVIMSPPFRRRWPSLCSRRRHITEARQASGS